MRVIDGRNVNQIYCAGRIYLQSFGISDRSRDGDVLVMPYPVMSIYNKPWERVLFDPFRDANPFFHLMESMWMLAGRDDAKWLDEYVKDFSSRYAEDDGRIHGAYGHRWRGHFDMDQLRICIDRLKANPKDRRVVITMWDPQYDLVIPGDYEPKDLPCNTQIYLRIVTGKLDLTVICRSNDMVWGAHGANAVHFSFLQEYLADMIGVKMGKLYQLSNNYHGYVKRMPKEWSNPDKTDRYSLDKLHHIRLVENPDTFDQEVKDFCNGELASNFTNTFLSHVAVPMQQVALEWRAHGAAKARDLTRYVEAPDWRLAAELWLDRRTK